MKRKVVEVERGRWSAKAKREAVLRLFRGEDLDALSRELKVTAAKLSEWPEARNEEVARLKETLGEMTMRCELQAEAIRRLKAGLPLDPRRSGT